MRNLIGPAHPNYMEWVLPEGATDDEYNLEGHIAKLLAEQFDGKKIVSAVGYARSGKDEFAKVAVEEFGYTRFAFADKLRECLYALNPVINPTPEKYFSRPKDPVRLKDAIDEYGWNGYKESIHSNEIRGLLQRMGTEVGRDLIDTDIWLKELDKINSDKIVITDTRFPNELDYVKSKGGKIVRINRPGFGPINDHISEVAIDDYTPDATILNDSSIEDYMTKVRLILKDI